MSRLGPITPRSTGPLLQRNPADPAWRDAITRAQRHPRQREAVNVIAGQQRRRGAAANAVAAAEQLRDLQTVAVVTGQQAASSADRSTRS
jgi:hypothetical protein